jgi:uncharacterized membrane protein
MLIVLLLSLFIAGVVFDALYLWRGSPTLAAVGFSNIAGGIVGGVLAAVLGLLARRAADSGEHREAASSGMLPNHGVRRERQSHRHASPGTRAGAVRFNRPAMQLHETTHDRQTEAEAFARR